ncbi:MAG: TraB/GumN family protein [Rubrivivax sp.]
MLLLATAVLGGPFAAPAAAAACPADLQPAAAAQRQAANPPDEQLRGIDRGFLWSLSKDGRVSWLFGSVHVGRPAWALPGPALAKAFAATDTLALELDPFDPTLAGRLTAAARAVNDRFAVDAALRQRLEHLTTCAGLAAAGQLPGALQLMALTLSAARHQGLRVEDGQELMLAAMARSAQRPIAALESVDQQLTALLPQDPLQARLMLEQGLRQLESGRAAASLLRLTRGWADGDLHTMQSYAQWCDCADTAAERALLTRLNDDRNPHLAHAIGMLHDQGRSVLAAVGALHMTGPQALPRLLAEQGFLVQRVQY